MKNKMVKYEENFFARFWNSIKNKFSKKSDSKEINPLNESVEKSVEKNIFMKSQKNNLEFIKSFENDEISEDDLTDEEIKILEEHYMHLVENLDKEISKKRILLNKLKQEQIPYLQTAINLKENN